MTALGEVVGALISQLDKGRSQADASTLEIAKAYKEHPLLAEFPVPRLLLEEVVIDLKMSIAAAPLPRGALSAQSRSEVLSRMGEVLRRLPKTEPALEALFREQAGLPKRWLSDEGPILQRLAALLPPETQVEPRSVALGAAAVIGRQLAVLALTPAARVKAPKARSFVSDDLPQIEGRLADEILRCVAEPMRLQAPAADRIEVLVTAAELQSIPPEKITTVRFKLQESDRSWTQVTTEGGETKDKLVPG